jgi:hypothetical protein
MRLKPGYHNRHCRPGGFPPLGARQWRRSPESAVTGHSDLRRPGGGHSVVTWGGATGVCAGENLEQRLFTAKGETRQSSASA